MLSDCSEEIKVDERIVNTLTLPRTELRFPLTGIKRKLVQLIIRG
jgi:hypothetical protein